MARFTLTNVILIEAADKFCLRTKYAHDKDIHFNPDFSNPQLFKPPVTRTKSRFASPQSNSVILLPISRTNFCFPWRFEKIGIVYVALKKKN